MPTSLRPIVLGHPPLTSRFSGDHVANYVDAATSLPQRRAPPRPDHGLLAPSGPWGGRRPLPVEPSNHTPGRPGCGTASSSARGADHITPPNHSFCRCHVGGLDWVRLPVTSIPKKTKKNPLLTKMLPQLTKNRPNLTKTRSKIRFSSILF